MKGFPGCGVRFILCGCRPAIHEKIFDFVREIEYLDQSSLVDKWGWSSRRDSHIHGF